MILKVTEKVEDIMKNDNPKIRHSLLSNLNDTIERIYRLLSINWEENFWIKLNLDNIEISIDWNADMVRIYNQNRF